jgi:hopene-associated glycosyltransferase HpnB
VPFLLLTDADIAHAPDVLARLVSLAQREDRDLVSVMARLHAESAWERLLVPAFVYFFAQLYPFPRVAARGRAAAAAGGCILVRSAALGKAGGFAALRDALIDDVALAKLVKRSGGRLWLGLSQDVRSIRAYPRLPGLWTMVARSAFVQLRHSWLLLAGTVAGLGVVYAVPPAALAVGLARRDRTLALLGGSAWLTMSATYAPVLREYGLPRARAALLPVAAGLYAAMTVDSAVRSARGSGVPWKGRPPAGAR